MGETVDVVIVSYGDFDYWRPFADRAVLSADTQTRSPDNIWCQHQDGYANLGTLRNAAAMLSKADRLIFLDADDELDPHYIEEMLKGEGDIRQPSTLGVVDGIEDDYPVLIPPHPGGFMVGNHLVIGCMVRAEMFGWVGGFKDLPILEDWDLFIRMRLAGASLGTCPEAIYRVHVNPNSRNQQNSHGNVYSQIQQDHQASWHAKGLQ